MKSSLDYLIEEIQVILKKYDAELTGENDQIGIRIYDGMSMPIISSLVKRITPEKTMTCLD